jgi:hypothetical protein
MEAMESLLYSIRSRVQQQHDSRIRWKGVDESGVDESRPKVVMDESMAG